MDPFIRMLTTTLPTMRPTVPHESPVLYRPRAFLEEKMASIAINARTIGAPIA